MATSRIETVAKIFGVAIILCDFVFVVLSIQRHNYAVNKMNELAKQHKAPDSTIVAILVADSLYMYSNHR